jgi:mono/diheme cytochrome c family protein
MRTALSVLLLVAAQGVRVAQPAQLTPAAAKPAVTALKSTDTAAGVYTNAQASRGDALYAANCAQCHLPDMGGKEPAPQLAGDQFLSRWLTRSVGDLYQKVTTMPAGKPGSLKPSEYIDLVALILQANDFPAGNSDLRPEANDLNLIKINKKGP